MAPDSCRRYNFKPSEMAENEKIRLVRGDTRPQLRLFLKDPSTGMPMDLTGAMVRLTLRAVGSSDIKETLICALAPGTINDAGEIRLGEPYTAFGSGGRAVCDWTATALDTAGEFEAEVEVTFADGGIQTVPELLRLSVRESLA